MVQVLTDLCSVSGPFSKVLGTVRNELVCSIYSDYYAMEQQGLQFSQLPYYKAAERLEADNKHLVQEKQAFKKVLVRRQVMCRSLIPDSFCTILVAHDWTFAHAHIIRFWHQYWSLQKAIPD